MQDIFTVRPFQNRKVPILLSSPHSGTRFPEELKEIFVPEVLERPEDTDWHIDKLYDFASNLGITLISANYSRYVVDLNRDPNDVPLYNDGRVITSVIPSCSFSQKPLYRSYGPINVAQRLKQYYDPYYKEIDCILQSFRKEFGVALLFDCHSIKRLVPSISPDPFPDLILGDNLGSSASRRVIDSALESLNQDKLFMIAHNNPFKGGHLTKYFGRPQEGIHALQLEMSQDVYMDEKTGEYEELKASLIRGVLKETLMSLSLELR